MDEQDRLRAAKLAPLRDDIRMGLDDGPSAPWCAEDMKREARGRRARKAA